MDEPRAVQAPMTRGALQDYLRRNGYPDAEVRALTPLGRDASQGPKAYGYGRPLRVSFTSGGASRDLVLRTMAADPFGHDRRADRAAVLLLAADTFGEVPRHVAPLDAGALGPDGELVPMAKGEIFLITEYAEGSLYAQDLRALEGRASPRPLDKARTEALARYLAALHGERRDGALYVRSLRDTVGSGEGIFGLCDSYPRGHPVASAARLLAIEQEANRWRWRLKERTGRCRRIHGDFHPFNILFRGNDDDFTVLDASRGGAGDPADDVTCLSVNYLAFGVRGKDRFEGALRDLWKVFWATYLRETGDGEILDAVAPFFAWRVLVLASPVWYPDVADDQRHRLLRFAERLLAGASFDPGCVDAMLKDSI